MAISELIQTAEYNVSVEKFKFYKDASKIFFWKKINMKPADSYIGKIKRVEIIFNDEYHNLGFGHIINDIQSAPFPPYIMAYAPYETFKDFYYILQTETPCYFFFSSDDDYPPIGDAGANVPLTRWYLNSSDEPPGEGPIDHSP